MEESKSSRLFNQTRPLGMLEVDGLKFLGQGGLYTRILETLAFYAFYLGETSVRRV